MRTATAFALLAFSLFHFNACSTYVNIPPQTGDVAGNDPNVEDVVQVQAKAIRAVIEDRPSKTRYMFFLPPGSSPRSYELVQEELGDLATKGIRLADGSMPPGSAAVKPPPAEVRQILIRGWTAKVDVVRPSDPNVPGSLLQTVTVDLKWMFADGWYVQGLHAWHIPVDDALKKSRQDAETQTPTGPGGDQR
jgi:hypothetical protein